MSLFITCEVGGDAIPQWLVPELQRRAVNQKKKKQRTKANKKKRIISANQTLRRFAQNVPNQNDRETPLGQRSNPAGASAEQKIKSLLNVDRSAVEIGKYISSSLRVPFCANPFSIELVDVTKDVKQRNLFGGPFPKLPQETQKQLLSEIHEPYFQRVCTAIESLLDENDFVIHFSLRTFPLRSKGTIRRTDVGLLYDSSNTDEVELCADLVDDMWYRAPMLKVRRNYPRRGSEMGITRRLRKHFARRDYVGIELWLNRAWAGRCVRLREEALEAMTESIASVTGLADLPLEEDPRFYDAA